MGGGTIVSIVRLAPVIRIMHAKRADFITAVLLGLKNLRFLDAVLARQVSLANSDLKEIGRRRACY